MSRTFKDARAAKERSKKRKAKLAKAERSWQSSQRQRDEVVIKFTNGRMNECPRCGTLAFEILRTHSHCVECLYSGDDGFYPNARRVKFDLRQVKITQLRKRNTKQAGEAA